eukprot:SAG25_NODE_13379_length_267_cov_91.565476_1_plen_89_part_11
MGWGVVHVAVPYSGVVCGCANGGCVSCMCAARWRCRRGGCVAVPVCLALCTAPALADWMGWGVVHAVVPYSGVVCGCADGGCVSCMCAA